MLYDNERETLSKSTNFQSKRWSFPCIFQAVKPVSIRIFLVLLSLAETFQIDLSNYSLYCFNAIIVQNDLLSNRAHIACRFTIAINMIIISVFLWTWYVLVRLYDSFDFSNSSQGNFTICADENPSTDEKLPSVEMISLFCLLRRVKYAELLTAAWDLALYKHKSWKYPLDPSPKMWFELSTFNHIASPVELSSLHYRDCWWIIVFCLFHYRVHRV
jgi:hypothetical protein